MTKSGSISFTVIGLALALGVGLLTVGCRTVQTPSTPTGDAFRVMSWNVNFGIAPTAEALDVIEHADVDVVLLQETSPAWAKALKRHLRKEFKYQRHHPDHAAGGLSVLSRYPIVDDTLVENDAGWFPGQRTTLQTPLGRVQTLNVHLRPPLSQTENMVSAYFSTQGVREEEMIGFLQALDPNDPTIIAGDFNEAAGGAVAAAHDDGFADALELYAPDATTWHWPLPIGEVTGTLDHIFVDVRLRPVDAWVLQAGKSDHYPLIAWVEAPTRLQAASPLRRMPRASPTSGYRAGR